jgi:VWFA-related protein
MGRRLADSGGSRAAAGLLALALVAAASAGAQEPDIKRAWEVEATPTPTPAPTPTPSPGPGDLLPVFPAAVEQVVVDVVVTDKKGQIVTGLPQDAFTIKEDGKPQSIVSFEAVQIPTGGAAPPPPPEPITTNARDPGADTSSRTFVIVFDDLHMTPFRAREAKAAVARFLKDGTAEGDRVALVSTGGGAWWNTRMTRGRDELIAMLKRLEGRRFPETGPDKISDFEAMRIHIFNDPQIEDRVSRRFETYGVNQAGQGSNRDGRFYTEGDPMVRARAAEVYYAAASRMRLSLNVIERMTKALEAAKGRKALILVSEGFIYDPNVDEFKDVVRAARRANVAIYFLDTRGLTGMGDFFGAEFGPALPAQDVGFTFFDNLELAAGSETLAADSGGFTVKNTNDLERGIGQIAADLRSYYLLGYNPSNTERDGRFRKIDVDVEGKGYKLRFRKGYYAPYDGPPKERRRDEVDPPMQAALDSPFERSELPLRMTAYVFDETLVGKAKVAVAADVDIRSFAFREEDGRFKDTLEFLMIVSHRESGEFYRYDQKVEMNLRPETKQRLSASWFPIVRDFEVAAGGYQAKLVVRDVNSGAIGTVVHEFDVPELGSFRPSSVIISDTLQPTAPGSDERPRPALVARRTFEKGKMIYFSYDVYGAARDSATGMPRVVAGFEVRRKDGGFAPPGIDPSEIMPTSLGAVSRLVGTTLEGAAPGDYELVVKLEDKVSGASREIREPFTLVAPGQS